MSSDENKYNTSPSNLKRLCGIYIKRCSVRVDAIKSGRIDSSIYEAAKYLSYWREVKIKGYIYEDLTSFTQMEVEEALEHEGG